MRRSGTGSMSNIPQIDGLQLAQDLRFLRWEWRLQRVGWGVLAIAVLAALTGILGKGPLSKAMQASPDGVVRLEYDRYLRYRDPTVLHIYVQPEAAVDGELRLSLNRGYLERVQLERIVPEPREERAGAERHTFVFAADRLTTSTWIAFHVIPDRSGSLPGELRVGEREPAVFRQFVYP